MFLSKHFKAPDVALSLFALVIKQAGRSPSDQEEIDSLFFKISQALEKDSGRSFEAVMRNADVIPEFCIDSFKTFYERIDDKAKLDEFRCGYMARMQYVFSPWPKQDEILFEINGVHAYSGSCRLIIESMSRKENYPLSSLGIWLDNEKKLPNFQALINLACHRLVLETASCYKTMSI
jgi:hypothetical protein